MDDPASAPYWRRRVRWPEVERALNASVTEARESHAVSGRLAGEQAVLLTYAEDFRDLLRDEGLVAPGPLKPSEDAREMQGGTRGTDRLKAVGQLLKLALAQADVLRVLESDGTWHRKRTRSGVRHVQHYRGFFRILFSPLGHPGTFFFFGFVYRQQGWRLREGEEERDLDYLDLLAGLEVWRHAGGDEASHRLSTWLEGDGPPDGPNWTIADELNRVIETEPVIFVPRSNRDWARFARRQSTRGFPDDKDEQVEALAAFYGEFLDAFRRVDGSLLQRDEETLLKAIRAFLVEVDVQG